MDPTHPAVDEDSELKEFNDPFEVVSESFVRHRNAEIDQEVLDPVSAEDEQLLASLIHSNTIEDNLLQEVFNRMVSMNFVSQEIASQAQNDFEFEKVRLNTKSAYFLTYLFVAWTAVHEQSSYTNVSCS
jgi:hypothetical protein